MKNKIAIKLFAGVLCLLLTLMALETASRAMTSLIPLPVLMFMHTQIKDANPAIMEEIKKKYPHLYEFREINHENWTYQPSKSSSVPDRYGKNIEMQTSAAGFLTPDSPATKDNQVVVMGDSCSASRHTPPAPQLLRQQINTPVYALACPLWGPSNYLDSYRLFAKGRGGKYVVVFSFQNDLADALHFERWKEGKSKLSFLKYLASRQSLSSSESFVSINMYDSYLDSHSFAWNWIKFVLLRTRLFPEAFANTSQPTSCLAKINGHCIDKEIARGHPDLDNEPEEFEAGKSQWNWIRPYFQQMQELQDEVKADGKQLVLVWIPYKERIYLPLLSEDVRRHYIHTRSGRISGYNDALQAFSAKAGIHFVDMTPVFLNETKAGKLLYYSYDDHPNEEANALFAKAAANRLKKLQPGI